MAQGECAGTIQVCIRKAKAHLEMNLVRKAQGNNKGLEHWDWTDTGPWDVMRCTCE